MIILHTNLELKTTFERLIKTMKEPVEWNGRFIVIGDYLILQGKLRSLFFQFESRKVLTNLIDIPVKEEEVIEIGTHTKVQNVLNLVLYAFGKWGLIRGVKVEQDYAQLNGLFSGVLREIGIEPGYTHENFRFFKDGIRFSYEDVQTKMGRKRKSAADYGISWSGKSIRFLLQKKRQIKKNGRETVWAVTFTWSASCARNAETTCIWRCIRKERNFGLKLRRAVYFWQERIPAETVIVFIRRDRKHCCRRATFIRWIL